MTINSITIPSIFGCIIIRNYPTINTVSRLLTCNYACLYSCLDAAKGSVDYRAGDRYREKDPDVAGLLVGGLCMNCL